MLTDALDSLTDAVAQYERVANGLSGDTEHTAAVELAETVNEAIETITGSLTAEDTCLPGDEDPTPSKLHGLEYCSAHHPDHYDQVCCRYKLHAGRQHVASDGREVVAVWPWTGPAPQRDDELAAGLTSSEIESALRTLAEAYNHRALDPLDEHLSTSQIELAARLNRRMQALMDGDPGPVTR